MQIQSCGQPSSHKTDSNRSCIQVLTHPTIVRIQSCAKFFCEESLSSRRARISQAPLGPLGSTDVGISPFSLAIPFLSSPAGTFRRKNALRQRVQLAADPCYFPNCGSQNPGTAPPFFVGPKIKNVFRLKKTFYPEQLPRCSGSCSQAHLLKFETKNIQF